MQLRTAGMIVMQGPKLPLARVVEDRPLVNSSTYAQRAPSERWSPEETDLFYRVGSWALGSSMTCCWICAGLALVLRVL